MAARSEHARYRAAALFLEDPTVLAVGNIPERVTLADVAQFAWAVRAEGMVDCSTEMVVKVINDLYGRRDGQRTASSKKVEGKAPEYEDADKGVELL